MTRRSTSRKSDFEMPLIASTDSDFGAGLDIQHQYYPEDYASLASFWRASNGSDAPSGATCGT